MPLVPQPLLKTRTQNGALLALRSATVLGLRWNSPPRILVVARHADGDRATPTASRTALTLCPRTAVILRQRQCSRGKRRWSSEGGRQRVSLRASPLLTRGKSSWKWNGGGAAEGGIGSLGLTHAWKVKLEEEEGSQGAGTPCELLASRIECQDKYLNASALCFI